MTGGFFAGFACIITYCVYVIVYYVNMAVHWDIQHPPKAGRLGVECRVIMYGVYLFYNNIII